MGFILDGLDTEDYDRQYGDRELLGRIVHYFHPYSRSMLLVALMLTLNSAAGTGGPILIAHAIDLLGQQPTLTAIGLLAGGILLLGSAGWTFNYIRQIFTARVVGNVVLQLRRDVFRATVGHDLSFYDTHPTGKIVSRVTSDTQDFASVVSLTVEMFSQLLLVAILSIWLLTISPWLTFLLFAMAPLAVIIALSFRRIARRVTRHARRVTAKINAQIQESISGIVVAKSFRQEHAVYATFDANNRQGYQVGLRRGLTLVTIFPVIALAAGLGTAVIFYAGGLATRAGSVTPGEWYLFMQAVGFFWWPLMGISSFWSQFQDGLSASERVFALIDREPKVRQSEFASGEYASEDELAQSHSRTLAPLQGRIDFRGVRFGYNENETVLPDFWLRIEPGETVALVGHTGAGKSSIARLICRFYEFQGGQILIDGHDIRSLNLQRYRQQIGLVPQEPFLFSGTVRDNIAYGRPDAGEADIAQAAMSLSEGDWLKSLPNGLDSHVGERGANLSMGQRQLVALARVILKDPAIFILDEATASVDPFTETQIQEGLESIMRERTAIVIAHRLSTVMNADRIIVMKDGRIIEEGRHEQLMEGGGHYAELYNTYFRHQSLDYIHSTHWRSSISADEAADRRTLKMER
jgi:ATP-binding cassette, subfamily B, bacterial